MFFVVTNVLLLMLMTNTAFAGQLSWLIRTPLPTATSRAATAVVNDTLYVLGGATNSGNTAAVESYDPIADSWQSKPSLSESRFGGADAFQGGIVYIAGGSTAGPVPTASILSYDTSTGMGSANVGTLVTARMRASAAIVNNKMYVIGGSNNSTTVYDTIEEFDLVTHVSTIKATMPVPLHYAAVVESQGKIYIIGGLGSNGLPLNNTWLYDPATNLFTPKSAVPVPVASRTAVAADGKIYLLGGITNYNAMAWTSVVQVYDPQNDSWQSMGNFTTSRYAQAAGVINNTLFVIGGNNDMGPISGNLSVNESAVLGPVVTATPPGGAYSAPLSVTLSATANGASTIFYTLDGSTPNTASSTYVSPINIAASTTLKYFALDGTGSSGIATEVYSLFDTFPPVTTASPSGGTYSAAQSVTLTSNETATVYYTLDGSTPTTGSMVYDGSVSIAADTTLKFFARDTAGNTEAVKTEFYTINNPYQLTVAVTSCGTVSYSTGGSCTGNCGQSFSSGTAIHFTQSACPGYIFAGWSGCDQVNGNQCLVTMNASKNVGAVFDFSTVQGSGVWSNAASMSSARYMHTATMLHNGKVLVVDRFSGPELYDTATNGWSPAGFMLTPRQNSTATLLSNGRVLVTGGFGGRYLASTELYDPVTNSWSSTGAMSVARINHTATLLPDGKVLVTGGSNMVEGLVTLSSAELYDPATNVWSAAGSMTTIREYHTATLLADGRVLVAGGNLNINAEGNIYFADIYDPATNGWGQTGSMSGIRAYHTATLLADGKVFVAGGNSNISTELYDPATNSWNAAASMTTSRIFHTATLLPDGKVMMAGGSNSSGYLSSAELYDSSTNSWAQTGSMITARGNHTATLLANGKVLATGGLDTNSIYLPSAELYGFITYSTSLITTAAPPGGRYTKPQTITLTASNDMATIRYTTDGSTPTSSSTIYNGPISVSATSTLKFFAIDNSGQESVKSATYEVIPASGGGSMGFSSPLQITLPSKPWSVAAGDFNQDGKADLAVANYENNSVTAYRGNGDGTFTISQVIGVGVNPTSVAFGIVNGYDNYLDIVAANNGSGSFSFLLGNGAGSFSYSGSYSSGAGSTAVVTGHFRPYTGPPDMAVVNPSTGYLNIYYGLGQGAFTSGPSYYVGIGAIGVTKGDFNYDNIEDLAVVNYDTGQLTLLRGDGTGKFNIGTTFATPKYARSVSAGDINGDGQIDLVVLSDGGDAPGGKATVTIFLGNGVSYWGSFIQYAQFEQPQFTSGVAIADLNGDGKADLALVNRSTGALSVLLQGFKFGSPVLINSTYPTYYQTVQAAMTNASDGAILETIAGDLYENLTVDRSIQLAIKGGVGTSSGQVTGYTILHGALTISFGSLVVENLVIM
jgi:N-acetylneuraminic acid mutarotase